MFRTVKVATVSLKPVPWDKSGNADRMEALIREAASQSPELVLLPEGLLDGYVVMEVIDGGRRPQDAVGLAEPLDGPYIRRFRALGRELGICLCFGFAERIGQEAYNAAIFLDEQGRLCGKHHKTRFAEGYHPSWRFNRIGRKLRAFDTPLGRCGILICSERWESLLGRTLVLDGARMLLIPTYGTRGPEQNRVLLALARENGVPIAQANASGANLIISRGEVVARAYGRDRITVGEIAVPAAPSRERARESEREWLLRQGPLMRRAWKGHEQQKRQAKRPRRKGRRSK